MKRRIILGHRGLGPSFNREDNQGLTENTITSFKAAVQEGAHGIELDIWLSKDQIPVVFHDKLIGKDHLENVPENGFTGKLSDYDASDIEKWQLRGGETIPRLVDVIHAMEALNPEIVYNLDIKSSDVIAPIQAVLNGLKPQYTKLTERMLICSYHHDILTDFKKSDRDIMAAACLKTEMLFGEDGIKMPGYIPIADHYADDYQDKLNNIVQSVKPFALDCVLQDVRPELVEFCAQNDLGLLISTGNNYTINDQKTIEQLSALWKTQIPFIAFKADAPSLFCSDERLEL